MSQVWEDTRIGSQAELLVLLALADHARDDGLCWPSMRSIAAKARIEERSAQRIIRRLIEKGFVELVSKGGCIDGQNTPNRCRVIGGDRTSPHGPTEIHSGVTVGQGVRGVRESPRGDSDGADGVTQGRTNHHIEPSRERITTTTYPDVDKEVSGADEPIGASSSHHAAVSVPVAGLCLILSQSFFLAGRSWSRLRSVQPAASKARRSQKSKAHGNVCVRSCTSALTLFGLRTSWDSGATTRDGRKTYSGGSTDHKVLC